MRRLLTKILLAASILALGCSCVKEFDPASQLEEGYAWVEIPFGAENYIEVQTKAHQSFASESKLHDLFVFIFDSHGNKIYDRYFSSADRVSSQTQFNSAANQQFEKWYAIEATVAGGTKTNGRFRIKSPIGSGLQVYCIANMDSDRTYVSSTLLTHTINSLSDLLNFKLYLNVDSIERSQTFTSVGYIEGVNITTTPSGTGVVNNDAPGRPPMLQLTRVDAKVKFTFKKGDRADANGQRVKTFVPEMWKIVNVPRYAYLVPRAEDASNPPSDLEPSSEAYAPYAADYFDTEWKVFEQYENSNSGSFAFYMLENRLPAKKPITDFQQRSKRLKNPADQRNLSTVVNYTENTDAPATKTILNFEYANDFATYILVKGTVTMDLVNDDAGQVLGADVEYMIHLGGEWGYGAGASWDSDSYGSGKGSYDTCRNTDYSYTVTINSVDNIRVEVESSKGSYNAETFRENQPGAWGSVTIAKEEIAVCDAHYESKTLSFHADNLVKEGHSVANALTWAVSTPFSTGVYVDQDTTPLYTLDYQWVHFRLNKKGADGNYFTDQRRKYTPRSFASYPSWRTADQNEEGDGTPGLAGRHNDGCMTIVQLVEYMKHQANLYAEDERNEHVVGYEKQSDFDNDIYDEVNGKLGPKISVTVFVDEYYYERNPLSGIASETLWKRFINTDDRYLHILSDSNVSYDGESRATGSVVTIQQKAIQSVYDISEANADLEQAWGLEHKDEHPDVWEWFPTTAAGNYDGQNGYINTVKLWGLCDAYSTNFKTTPKTYWGSFMDIEVPNEVPQLKESYKSLRYSCMTRNRDNNGDGIIDKDEVRWYTASIGQLTSLYMGEACISMDSRLYNRSVEIQYEPNHEINRGDGTMIRPWMQHVVSSTEHSGGNPTLVWAEEGIATGAYGGNQEGANPWMTVRCCRNLGMDNVDSMTEISDPIITTSTSGGYTTFDVSNLMKISKREYLSTELPMHFEDSPLNLLYEKFEMDDSNSGTAQTFANYNNSLNTNLNNSPCPDGWRTPNQREVAAMVYFDSAKPQTMSRTAWSRGYYQGQAQFQTNPDLKKNDKYGFIYNGNITLNPSAVSVRCVRDVRVR